MSYTAFIDKVEQGVVETATISDKDISGQYRNIGGDLRNYRAMVPEDPNLVQRLLDRKVEVKREKRMKRCQSSCLS